MRLLKWDSNCTFSLTKNLHDNIPPYAILSHTWGAEEDEVTFADLENSQGLNKKGYEKLQFCAQQARKDGIGFFWIDTCCINKRDSVELSEAITSMHRWYKDSVVCYVYLIDVVLDQRDNIDGPNASNVRRSWKVAFRRSRWFTRGWTLQELIAPDNVVFFSRDGERLGSKATLMELIHEITTIPLEVFRGQPLSEIPVAERLRWTKGRTTTRKEDQAYCLLGLFKIFMPLIYGEGDNAFVRLQEHIDRLPESVSLRDRREKLLNSLTFEQMNARQSTIKSAYDTTCRWFLQHTAYLSWLDAEEYHYHYGFLWINGKPGTGKSTLMKFAHAHAESTAAEDQIVIAFFFNARGEVLEKLIAGMYRTLLFELLQRATDLKDVLDDLLRSPGIRIQHHAWTTEQLCKLLSSAFKRLGNRRLTCFIDALDECDVEEVQEMVRFFEDLGLEALEAGSNIHVCFASRHYPTIDVSNCQRLVLEDEHGHTKDLAKYVQSHLRAENRKNVEELKAIILERSNGVFIWAVLVIEILNKELRGGRIFAVKKKLQEIPTKLSDLFKNILRRDYANMKDLLLCLQWILFAKRPLRREEFYFAMVSVLDPDPETLGEWDSDHVTLGDMDRFVLNSSKGLAELTKSTVPTIQFIHESVRDFLIKDNGLRELWPELAEDVFSVSHDQLKHCCRIYLSINAFDKAQTPEVSSEASIASALRVRLSLASKYPFLEYANQCILHHVNEAAKGIPQDDFLKTFSLVSWVKVNNIFAFNETRRHTCNVSFLYIFAEHNLARLITAVCKKGSKVNIRGEWYQFPLFAALSNGHQDAVRALLNSTDESPTEDIISRLDFGTALVPPKDEAPLIWTIRENKDVIAEALIQLANTEVRDGQKDSRLRFHDNDLEARDNHGNTALLLAVGSGKENLVQQLLNKNVDIEARNDDGLTALIWAAQKGHSGIIQQLLDKRAKIEAKDYDGQTALISAVICGRGTAVRQLLDNNACAEARNKTGCTPLMLAAKFGQDVAVQHLLDRNANIDARNNAGQTTLILAACGRHVGVVQLLLLRTADIEAQDTNGQTALMWAIRARDRRTVRQLLDRDADVEKKDNTGQTALIWGARCGYDEIVQQLLEKNADIDASDNNNQTALMWAAYRGHCEVVQRLLDRNANIEVRDKSSSTALDKATASGRRAIVPLLRKKLADTTTMNEISRQTL